MRTRPFGAGGPDVGVIGQGTWNLPSAGPAFDAAATTLREAIEFGMTHIDTAEMYGNGKAEELVARAIAGLPRERLFIVSKVLPSNGTFDGVIRACERSLRRLQTGYLDCYLLHWRGAHALDETLAAFERLVDDGKIRAFGVSNFDVDDLEEARERAGRHPIACNQVLYHVGERGIENSVLPYCREHGIALVGYSPFGSGDFPARTSPGGRALAAVAQRRGTTPHGVALAFVVRLDGTFAIPKAATVAHARENAAAANIVLDARDVAELEAAFPLGAAGPLAML